MNGLLCHETSFEAVVNQRTRLLQVLLLILALAQPAMSATITPPAISRQPQSLIVFAGETVTFNVMASGGLLSYQWSLNQAILPWATNATLSLTDVQAVNAGSYSVTVTNIMGMAISTPAILSLAPLPAILAAKPVAGNLNLSFPIVARHNYAVQFRDSLLAGGWLGLTNFNASTSANAVMSDTLSASQRFYRLQVTPSP